MQTVEKIFKVFTFLKLVIDSALPVLERVLNKDINGDGFVGYKDKSEDPIDTDNISTSL